MRRLGPAALMLLQLLILTQPVRSLAQVAPSDPSVELPEFVREMRAKDPTAFTFAHAWKPVAARVAKSRAFLDAQSPETRLRYAPLSVTGDYQVPVFAVRFANTPADPYPTQDLEDALFAGTGATLHDYYEEISGNRINVTGAVHGWHALPNTDAYYAGTSNGLVPGNAKLGELIAESIAAHDATVDFGQYDNDGPDGIPNSGDDDGYVDFVAFVHPETGAECGGNNGNIWSHRWRYSVWPTSGGSPYVTSDASANGGQILIEDYTIQPGVSCDGMSMIEIGVFCHEFGHAFDLPDLYDINGGGGSGLGHWCLMAAGNWNDPDQPAHMSAWAKWQLGWITLVDIDWQQTTIDVLPVQESGTAYRLGFTEDRWRRRMDCPLGGGCSLAVGLDDDESQSRGWPADGGYGNGWLETVAHDFHYDGSGPVTLTYDYGVDTEPGFDFAFVLFERDGVESNLAVYDGEGGGVGSHDLTALLGGVAGDYRIKFRLKSDPAWSNEDGLSPAACAGFGVDNIALSGGGEHHHATFEEHLHGWYQPDNEVDNPTSEFWLVENRQATGFDANLYASGLMIYHVDQEVLSSSLGNSGGSSDSATRGIVIEEADGGFDLITSGGNRGDAGDPWPGNTANASFDELSLPSSASNGGRQTPISVKEITEFGTTIRATFMAGDPAPQLFSAAPSVVPSDSTDVVLDLGGLANLRHGVQLRLVQSGQPDVLPAELEWLDYDRLYVRLDLEGAASGFYDVVIENPDGQTAVLFDGFRLASTPTASPASSSVPRAFALGQNFPNPFNPSTTLRFEVPQSSRVRIDVFDLRGRRVANLVDSELPAGYHDVQWDGTDDDGIAVASGIYFARMSAPGFTKASKMLLAK